MLQAETFISGNSATLASTPSFVGLRRALRSIFFIFTHPKEIHEGRHQIGFSRPFQHGRRLNVRDGLLADMLGCINDLLGLTCVRYDEAATPPQMRVVNQKLRKAIENEGASSASRACGGSSP
jgi:hypothetical protein